MISRKNEGSSFKSKVQSGFSVRNGGYTKHYQNLPKYDPPTWRIIPVRLSGCHVQAM